MENIKRIFNKIPGWVYTLAIVGFFYLTGLHTQVIGQVQRLVLATGLLKPTVPELSEAKPATNPHGSKEPAATVPAYPVADFDFTLRTLAGETVTMESLKGKGIFMN